MMQLRLGILFLALVSLISVGSAQAELQDGDPFPAMELTDLDGDTYDLSRIDGQVVMIYFMGSGCSICIDLADRIERDFVGPYRDRDFQIFAVDALDGLPEELARLRDEAGVRFPFLLNGSRLAAACDLAWHSFVVLDGDGTVRYVRQAMDTSVYQPTDMAEVIDRLLDRAVENRLVTWGEIKRIYEP